MASNDGCPYIMAMVSRIVCLDQRQQVASLMQQADIRDEGCRFSLLQWPLPFCRLP